MDDQRGVDSYLYRSARKDVDRSKWIFVVCGSLVEGMYIIFLEVINSLSLRQYNL